MARTIRSSEGRFGDALGVGVEMGVATTTGLGIGVGRGIGLVITRGLGIDVGMTTGIGKGVGDSTTGIGTGGTPTTTGAGVAGGVGFLKSANNSGAMVREAAGVIAGGTIGDTVVIMLMIPWV